MIRILAAIGLLISSCTGFRYPEFKGIEDVHIREIEGRTMVLETTIKAYNPNTFLLKIKPSSVDVHIDGNAIGTINLNKKVCLKAKKENTITVPLSLQLNDGAMFSLIRFMNRDSIQIDVQGKIKGGLRLFNQKYPVKFKKMISGNFLKHALGRH
jgi:LEA14-like dessication related protein